jgi:polysaccharide pyruvyl transferase CsaB
MRIALSGYYGCGNTGDEAVLAGIVESFAKRAGGSQVELTVFSADPADTHRRHNLPAVDRMNLSALRSTLKTSDLLISGGGSLLQDTTSLRSLLYYLWVVRLARKTGVPVMFYAQGIGPLRRKVSRMLTARTANRVQQITVRDAASADLLRRIGVRKPPIGVTADPAFALSPAPPERVHELLRQAGAPEESRLVGIALRPWKTGGPAPDDLGRAVRLISERTGVYPVFLPMQPPGDLELSRAVNAAAGVGSVLEQTLSPQEALGVAAACGGILAMRLHALIFGASAGVPLVALSYDPKVTQLMNVVGQGDRCVELAQFDADAAAVMMSQALETGAVSRDSLCLRARELAELALVNVDRALSVAGM